MAAPTQTRAISQWEQEASQWLQSSGRTVSGTSGLGRPASCSGGPGATCQWLQWFWATGWQLWGPWAACKQSTWPPTTSGVAQAPWAVNQWPWVVAGHGPAPAGRPVSSSGPSGRPVSSLGPGRTVNTSGPLWSPNALLSQKQFLPRI